MSTATASPQRPFRVGRVRAYLRGQVWYLCYHENGMRRRPRVGADRNAARQLAAQLNAQLENNQPAQLSFEPITVDQLQRRWLEHHDIVLRSSLATIGRYRTATAHLITFVRESARVRLASHFTALHAEHFVRWLRTIEVAPNGHPNSQKRPLMDKGIKYILEACRALFNFAAKRRHLPPYVDNPFTLIEVGRLPVEDAKPIVILSPEQEGRFLEACSKWEFPIFLTLMLTGLRPGELCHLLVEDLDLKANLLHVRNKPSLGWQVKTRSQRQIPVVNVLAEVLRQEVTDRTGGVLFRQRRCAHGYHAPFEGMLRRDLEAEAAQRLAAWQQCNGRPPARKERLTVVRGIWRSLAAVREDQVRTHFIRIAKLSGLRGATAPKILRHGFATSLQVANADPLVRNLLMGHAPVSGAPGGGLGMTAVYTHTSVDTLRQQLELAMLQRFSIIKAANAWLDRQRSSC